MKLVEAFWVSCLLLFVMPDSLSVTGFLTCPASFSDLFLLMPNTHPDSDLLVSFYWHLQFLTWSCIRTCCQEAQLPCGNSTSGLAPQLGSFGGVQLHPQHSGHWISQSTNWSNEQQAKVAFIPTSVSLPVFVLLWTDRWTQRWTARWIVRYIGRQRDRQIK